MTEVNNTLKGESIPFVVSVWGILFQILILLLLGSLVIVSLIGILLIESQPSLIFALIFQTLTLIFHSRTVIKTINARRYFLRIERRRAHREELFRWITQEYFKK